MAAQKLGGWDGTFRGEVGCVCACDGGSVRHLADRARRGQGAAHCRVPRARRAASSFLVLASNEKKRQGRGIVGGSRLRPTTRVYPLPSARTEAHLAVTARDT